MLKMNGLVFLLIISISSCKNSSVNAAGSVGRKYSFGIIGCTSSMCGYYYIDDCDNYIQQRCGVNLEGCVEENDYICMQNVVVKENSK